MRTNNFILILVAFLLFSCAAANVTRGPFEFSFETEDQRHVEDVIVRLSNRVMLMGPWENKGTSIYNETKVTPTNVLVKFPVGRVSDSDTVSMYFRAYHPCFAVQNTVSFDGTSRKKVNFGVRLLAENNSSGLWKHDIQHTPWLTDYKNPLSDHANWQHYFGTPQAVRQYFAMAIKIGRTDLVEKYLPQMLSYYLKDTVLDERSAGAIKFTHPHKNGLQEYDLVRNAALEGEQGPAFIQLYDFYLNKFKELATYSFMSLDSSGHNKFFEFAYEINRIDLIGKYLALIFQSRIKGEEYCANFYAVEDIYQLTHPVPEPVEPFNRKKAVKKFRQQFPDGPQIGDEFSDTLKDGSRGPAMVVLPMGSFHMGSNYGEYDEQPIHRVTISQPIAMMKYEVTYDDWDKCVAAKKCNVDRHEHYGADEGWGRGNRPLINVTMENVKNYALWLSEQTSKRYRLASEAEWEFAARGGSTSESPLGDTLGQASVNTAISKCCNVASSTKNQWEYTAPVGSFKANEFGLHDLYGNVSEFVSDCYHKNYQGGPTDGSAWMGCNTKSYGLHRVVRGGHFRTEQNKLRSTTRANTDSAPNEQTGFRLVQEL